MKFRKTLNGLRELEVLDELRLELELYHVSLRSRDRRIESQITSHQS